MGRETFWTWLLGAFGFHLLLVTRFAVNATSALGSVALYFVAGAMASWQVCDYLMGGAASESWQAWPSVVKPQRLILVCVWAILLTSLFTAFVYPLIKPELGGGAVWKARLSWRVDSDSTARAAASGIVAIVDRDETSVAVLACSRSGAPEVLSIPTEDVRSIRLGERVPLSSFAEDFTQHCGRLDAVPKTQSQRNQQLLLMMLGLSVLAALNIRNLRREVRYWRKQRTSSHPS